MSTFDDEMAEILIIIHWKSWLKVVVTIYFHFI